MNQQQVKYTIARVEAVEKRKLAELKKECTVPAKTKTDEEIVELIRAKKVKLKDGPIQRDRYSSLSVADIFDLSKYVNFEHVTDDYLPRSEEIRAEAARVRDEIMLGDQQAALELLRKFDA